MEKKSLAWNTILYVTKVFTSMLFPLITFPYISRILGASGVGKYNFSSAYVSYFSLIAGLGISTYAIREGAKIRDDRRVFNDFAQVIFSINIVSALVALGLLCLSIVFVPRLFVYKNILIILAINIPLTTLGTEWIFNVYEDFYYITLRSIGFQFLSMILMFVFVRTNKDVLFYAAISVVASAGSNILNYQKSTKYFRHCFVLNYNSRKYIQPIFILFASAVASQVYINADITMLGIMQGDYATGIYSAASKIYNIVRMLLTAVIGVLLPRLSYLKQDDNPKVYNNLLSKIFNGYIAVIFPAAIGLLCISSNALFILSGREFVAADISLKILSISLIFSTLGSLVANSILIIYSRENVILYATCIGAMLNIILNVSFIHNYSYTGAAITTLLSEIMVFVIQCMAVGRLVKVEGILPNMIKVFVGAFSIYCISSGIHFFHWEAVIETFVTVIICSVSYFLVLLIFRHTTAVFVLKIITKKRKEEGNNE